MAGRSVYPDPYNQQYQRNDPLPAGWEMLFDKNTGWPYFVDHNTQQTSWQDPRMGMASQMGYPHPHQSFDTSRGQDPSFPNHGKSIEIPVVHESARASPSRQMPQHTSTWHSTPQSQPYPHAQPQHGQTTCPQGSAPQLAQQAHLQQQPSRGPTGVREIPVQHLSINESTHPRQPTGHESQGYQQQPQQGHPQPQPQMQGYPQPQSGYQGYPAQTQGYPAQTQGYPPQTQGYTPQTQGYSQQPARESPPAHHTAASQQSHPTPRRDNEPIVIPIIHENSKPEAQVQSNQHRPHQPHYSSSPTVNEQSQRSRSPHQPTGVPQNPEANAPSQQQREKSDEEKAFDIINGVVNDVKNLEVSVNIFNGKKTDKEYKYLEEMLTRSLIKLDAVQAGGHDKIRESRRNAVKLINAALDLLELKACANQQQQQGQRSAGTTADNSARNVVQSSQRNTLSGMDSERSKSMEPPSDAGSESSNSGKKKGSGGNPSHVKEMVLESEINC